MTRHVSEWKHRQLEELAKLANDYPVIAVADLSSFPAALFQKLRKKLQGKATVRVSKTRIIKKAFEQSSIDSEKLNRFVAGSVGIIFTAMNPFELYAFLKRNKGNVAAKEGAIAPEDIIVPAGDTGLPPGPALSDLKAAGLKVMVQGSTIARAEDKVVTKKGEPISAAVAGTLSKLDIKPIKVGLNIVACYENKEVFEPGVLDIDSEKVMANFMRAYTLTFNLAFNAGYFIKETMPLLVQKAFRSAKAVALDAGIVCPATIGELAAKAARQASALKAGIPETVAEEKKETVAEGESKEAKPAGEEKVSGQEQEQESGETKKEKAQAQEAVEKKKGEAAEEKPAKEKKKELVPKCKPAKEAKAAGKGGEKPAGKKKAKKPVKAKKG